MTKLFSNPYIIPIPNWSPNGSQTASELLLEATGSDNSILYRSDQDFHRFSAHTEAWNLLPPEGFLKMLSLRQFRLSSLTKRSQAVQNRYQHGSKSFPNRSWKHIVLPWTRLLVPSELDLELKIVPEIGSKFLPTLIVRGILARSRLQRQFLERPRRLQALFQGLRDINVYSIR